MAPEVERKNRRIGWIVSVGSHLLLLLFFFLMMAWREPDPPLPEYGIELNFGIEDAGTGDVQPEETAAAPPETTEAEDLDQLESQPVENQSEQEIPEEIIPENDAVQDVETQDTESPDQINPPEPSSEANEQQPGETEELQEKTSERPIETRVDEPAEGTSDQPSEARESSSQGDKDEATGDQGDPQGTLDSRALYGSHGGGGGPRLDLSGWIWDFEPKPQDTSNENGRIVFEIKIDDRGEIISVRTLEKSVSPEVERIYRQEVESLTFSPLSSNTIPAPVSTGRITFIIQSR